MLELAAFQATFARDVAAEELAGPLAAQPGFAVYRNTPLRGAADVLAANYPTIEKLIGKEAFGAVALIHARVHRPPSPILCEYGEAFPDFLAASPLAADLPYLADVARIDRLWTEAFFAADAPAIAPETLADSAVALAQQIALHPASRHAWLESPAVTIWLAHRQEHFVELELDWHGEGVHVTRSEAGVAVQSVTRAEITLLDALAAGATLPAGMEAMLNRFPDADVPAIFARLIHASALTLHDRPGDSR